MNRRKYFSLDALVIVPPAARGDDAEWEQAQQSGYYLWWGDKRGVWGWGYNCRRGGTVGERSSLMISAHLSPFSVVLPAKSENRNGNCEQGLEGSRFRRSWVYVVERGLPRISARGYIVISQVKLK